MARTERSLLCDLLDQVGPDAPTLCAGWMTRNLGIHLAVRERRPDAAAGIFLPPLAGYADRVRRGYAGQSWGDLVGLVRDGPPPWSPLAPLDRVANTLEFFVHHEDVRRAQPDWTVRELDEAHEGELWRRLTRMAPLLLRRSPVGVVLRPGSGPLFRARSGHSYVTLTGAVGELALYAFGRGEHANVEVRGHDADVERFRQTRLAV
ncbi:MAG: TIGR03085 family metal-binding protein [Streptosporangiales bacterium]